MTTKKWEDVNAFLHKFRIDPNINFWKFDEYIMATSEMFTGTFNTILILIYAKWYMKLVN